MESRGDLLSELKEVGRVVPEPLRPSLGEYVRGPKTKADLGGRIRSPVRRQGCVTPEPITKNPKKDRKMGLIFSLLLHGATETAPGLLEGDDEYKSIVNGFHRFRGGCDSE